MNRTLVSQDQVNHDLVKQIVTNPGEPGSSKFGSSEPGSGAPWSSEPGSSEPNPA